MLVLVKHQRKRNSYTLICLWFCVIVRAKKGGWADGYLPMGSRVANALSLHVDVGTGLMVACAHHTWHNVPGATHYGLVNFMAVLRPRGGVHWLPFD